MVLQVENAFDPKQARDARGRWKKETAALEKSREAHARTKETASSPKVSTHLAAKGAHAEAARHHRERAKRHADVGNRRAAKLFTREAEEHEQLALGHGSEADFLARGESKRREVHAARSAAARKGAETKREQEDAVLANIPPQYWALYQRNRNDPRWRRGSAGRSLKEGTPHQRAERFLEWAESDEGQRENLDAIEDAYEAREREIIRAYQDRPPTDEEEYEMELAAERAALEENPPTMAAKKTKKRRAVRINPDVAPDLYAQTFVAEFVANAAKDLAALAQEIRDGADLFTLRGRLDANIASLQAVSLGLSSSAAAPAAADVVSVECNPGKPPTFREAHWGRNPKGERTMTIPDPAKNARIIGLGELVEITYRTQKGGDGAPVDYVHKFKPRYGLLAYGSRDGRLYVVGGSYKVTSRGIVG